MCSQHNDEHTCRQKEASLRTHVADHLQKAAPESVLRQQGKRKQHIGNLADRRIGKPLFRDFFPECHGGSHQDRQEGKTHPDGLYPGTPEEVGTDTIVDQTDDGNDTCLGDDTGEQGGCRRRRNGMCRGKPAVHGVHAGLGAESDDTHQDHRKRDLFMGSSFGAVHESAVAESHLPRRTVEDIKDCQKAHQSAGDRIKQVFETRCNGLFGHLMENHGNRREGRQLEGKIETDHIGGHAYRHHSPQCDEEECKKDMRPLLMLHIHKGIKTYSCEKNQHGCQSESAQTVESEGDHRLICKSKQYHAL